MIQQPSLFDLGNVSSRQFEPVKSALEGASRFTKGAHSIAGLDNVQADRPRAESVFGVYFAPTATEGLVNLVILQPDFTKPSNIWKNGCQELGKRPNRCPALGPKSNLWLEGGDAESWPYHLFLKISVPPPPI